MKFANWVFLCTHQTFPSASCFHLYVLVNRQQARMFGPVNTFTCLDLLQAARSCGAGPGSSDRQPSSSLAASIRTAQHYSALSLCAVAHSFPAARHVELGSSGMLEVAAITQRDGK